MVDDGDDPSYRIATCQFSDVQVPCKDHSTEPEDRGDGFCIECRMLGVERAKEVWERFRDSTSAHVSSRLPRRSAARLVYSERCCAI